jgi:hypothetical protein
MLCDYFKAIGHAVCTATELAECVPLILPLRRVRDAHMSTAYYKGRDKVSGQETKLQRTTRP